MLARCKDSSREDFHNYGERGIFICERWLESFENFLADMGEAPDRLTLERVDNDGPYSPDNCVWADYLIQGSNRRTNRQVLLENGDLQPFPMFLREHGIKRHVIYNHLKRAGRWFDQLRSTELLAIAGKA